MGLVVLAVLVLVVLAVLVLVVRVVWGAARMLVRSRVLDGHVGIRTMLCMQLSHLLGQRLHRSLGLLGTRAPDLDGDLRVGRPLRQGFGHVRAQRRGEAVSRTAQGEWEWLGRWRSRLRARRRALFGS